MIRSFLAVLLLLAACADVPDDAPDAAPELEKSEQAIFIQALPESLTIKPAAITQTGWAGFDIYWHSHSYVTPTILNYAPDTVGAEVILQKLVGNFTCTKPSTTTAHCSNGVLYTCPGASMNVKPTMWRIGAPYQPWQSWAYSGDENWERWSSFSLTANNLTFSVSGTDRYVNCYYPVGAKLYQLKHK